MKKWLQVLAFSMTLVLTCLGVDSRAETSPLLEKILNSESSQCLSEIKASTCRPEGNRCRRDSECCSNVCLYHKCKPH